MSIIYHPPWVKGVSRRDLSKKWAGILKWVEQMKKDEGRYSGKWQGWENLAEIIDPRGIPFLLLCELYGKHSGFPRVNEAILKLALRIPPTRENLAEIQDRLKGDCNASEIQFLEAVLARRKPQRLPAGFERFLKNFCLGS
jgi:hypothetical protein